MCDSESDSSNRSIVDKTKQRHFNHTQRRSDKNKIIAKKKPLHVSSSRKALYYDTSSSEDEKMMFQKKKHAVKQKSKTKSSSMLFQRKTQHYTSSEDEETVVQKKKSMLMPGVKCIYKDEKNDIELLLGPDKKSDTDLFVNKLAWVASVYKIKPTAASKVLQRHMNDDIKIHVGRKYEDKVNFRKNGAASDALRLPGAMILLISMKDTKVSNAHRDMMANLLIDNSVNSVDKDKLRSTWNKFKDTAGYVISVDEQIGHNWFHTTKDSNGTDYFHMYEFIAVVKQVMISTMNVWSECLLLL